MEQLSSSKEDTGALLSLLRERNIGANEIADKVSATIERQISDLVERMDAADRNREAELLHWLQRVDSEFGDVRRMLPRLDQVVAALQPPDPRATWKRFAETVRGNYDKLSRSYYPYAQIVGAVPLRCQVNEQYTDSLVAALLRGERDSEGYKPGVNPKSETAS